MLTSQKLEKTDLPNPYWTSAAQRLQRHADLAAIMTTIFLGLALLLAIGTLVSYCNSKPDLTHLDTGRLDIPAELQAKLDKLPAYNLPHSKRTTVKFSWR